MQLIRCGPCTHWNLGDGRCVDKGLYRIDFHQGCAVQTGPDMVGTVINVLWAAAEESFRWLAREGCGSDQRR
jgi:hypothetical protein